MFRSFRTLLNAGIIVGAAWAPQACAGIESDTSSPSPRTIAALRESLATESHIRVMGTFGSEEIAHPVVATAGIGSADRGSTRSSTAEGTAVPGSRLIPWSEISEVRAGHSLTKRGMVYGAVIGLFASGFVMTGITSRSSSDEAGLAVLVVAPVMVLAGTLIGASIGRSHGTWRTVYRAGEDAGP